MKFTDFTRRVLAFRRQKKDLESKLYVRHETDWEIHRGYRYDATIVDVQISTCGKYVYTLLSDAKQHAENKARWAAEKEAQRLEDEASQAAMAEAMAGFFEMRRASR